METFIAVCLAILVVEFSVLMVVLIMTLLQIKRAAQAAEVLTYRVDHQVAAFGETIRSGWMQFFGAILTLITRRATK